MDESDVRLASSNTLPRETLDTRIDRLCDEYEVALRDGRSPRIEDYLARCDGSGKAALLKELLLVDVSFHRCAGEAPDVAEYRRRFPEHENVFAGIARQLAGPPHNDSSSPSSRQRDKDAARVREALQELDEDDRRLIESRYLEGRDYSQLAKRLERPEFVVQQELRRALAKLERAQRLLAAMDRKAMPTHYRELLCAARIRSRPVEQIAAEYKLQPNVVRALLESAEAWMQSSGESP